MAQPHSTAKMQDDFIAEKMADYVEPTREGTRRGERVGFSQRKYRATLLALKGDMDLKKDATMLGVSYGLLRKWRSEPAFKSLFKQHVLELRGYLRAPKPGIWKRQIKVPDPKFLRAFIEARRTTSSIREVWNPKITPLLLRSNLQSVSSGRANPKELKQCQLLVLDYLIESLKDRNTALKRRRDMMSLLEDLKESLNESNRKA